MNKTSRLLRKTVVALTFLALILPSFIRAQEFGMSADFEGSMFKYSYSNGNTDTTYTQFRPGVRINVNYLCPGYSIPVSGFNEFGITYFFPSSDSAWGTGYLLSNGNQVGVHGLREAHMMDYSLRFGYEIPQGNDFLLVHFGWGFDGLISKSTFKLPEKSTAFPYEKSDFTSESFAPRKNFTFEGELLVGATYELEHFTLIGQYNVMIPLTDDYSSGMHYGFRHGFKLGILYPFKKW